MRKLSSYILSSILIAVCLGAIPAARAVDPPPDGGYPNENTAEGEEALLANTTGDHHTAIGYHALHTVVGNTSSTAVGSITIINTDGGLSASDAIGFQALRDHVVGPNAVAIGVNAQLSFDGGEFDNDNVAVGANALSAPGANIDNCAVGSGALQATLTSGNVALGYNAMGASEGGGNCMVIGSSALLSGNGFNNVALGAQALMNLIDSSENNIAIGFGAGSKLMSGSSNNIDIGHQGKKGDDGKIRIGTRSTHRATFIAGISGVTVSSGVQVVINGNGQLGTVTSSARYKQAIKPMAKSSEAIYSLHPVTYRYKKEWDPAGIPQFGLVAEQVAEVAPELVAYDEKGKPYSVRYQAVNAMLLNEFQKEEHKGAVEDATLHAQGQELDQLAAKLAELETTVESKPRLPAR
jgi:hypothetical protein